MGKYQIGVKTYQGLGRGWRILIMLSVKTCGQGGQDSCWDQSDSVLINRRILTSIWSELGPISVRPERDYQCRIKIFHLEYLANT